MASLPAFEKLKIEAFTMVMSYAPREDFAASRQELIDCVRRETITVLRSAGKPGTVDARVDDDGDIVFKYEHSSFHFLLSVGSGLAGAQFKDLYDHRLAVELLKPFYAQVVQTLNLQDVDVFTIDFKNIFDLARSAPKNYEVLQAAVMPTMADALAPLFVRDSVPARLDFKVGWDYDDRHTCYFNVECPGNDENTTVWTTLNLRTRDDIMVSVDQAQLADDIDQCYRVYCGPYAETVKKTLNGLELNLAKRRLTQE